MRSWSISDSGEMRKGTQRTAKKQSQRSQCPIFAFESFQQRHQCQYVHDHVEDADVYQRVRVRSVYYPSRRVSILAL